MQPEQASFLLSVLSPMIESEYAHTRRVLAAIPEERRDYRPDEKSRSAFELAWHIASSDVHFLEGLLRADCSVDEPKLPPGIDTIAGIVALYESKMPGLLRRLKSMPAEDLAKQISVGGMFDHPAVVYLLLMMHHAVHHRGSLCAYLRPMGARVPSVYGPSHDETSASAA